MHNEEQLWAIVLAAGDGSRLAGLTRALDGKLVPKQFASFAVGGRSMLELAIEQICGMVSNDHISVVVPAANQAIARRQLEPFPGVTLVAEPRNRGTALSLLLPLASLLEKVPAADVIVVPATYVVKEPHALLDGMARARSALSMAPITLLGVAATSARIDRTWILPGRTITPGVRSVAGFVAVPHEALAKALLKKQALWHTFFLVAEGTTLWRVTARHLSTQAAAIHQCVAASNEEAVRRTYESIRPADFASEVLGRQLGIAVADVTDCDFTHIGDVQDVLTAFPDVREFGGTFAPSFVPRVAQPLLPALRVSS